MESAEVHYQAQERGLDSSGSAPGSQSLPPPIAGAELPARDLGMATLRMIVAITFY